MQFVRNGPPIPGEEKVWLRDKSYRGQHDRDDDDDQIKVTIHTTSNYDYDPKINSQTNDNGNYSNGTNDGGETLEMLEITQPKLNNLNGRETNGHRINNCSGPYINTASTEPVDAYDNL